MTTSTDVASAPPPAEKRSWAGRIAVIGILLLAVGWCCALFFGLPMLYAKKVEQLVGQGADTVETQLGVPTQRWTAAEFVCAAAYPCKEKPIGGGVSLYADERKQQGYYLFFDDQGRLGKVEPVGVPEELRR